MINSGTDKIDKILEKLETKSDDEYARSTFVGKAVSKSKENLHLMTSGGIVAIPIAEITEILSPKLDSAIFNRENKLLKLNIDVHDDVLQITVKDSSRVRNLIIKDDSLPTSDTDDDWASHWLAGHTTATDGPIHDACDA